MAKPISLGELAVRAGVSPATASIVLNDRPLARHVAEKTRARILRLATEFNYRPNHLAKAMLQQSTRMIGFICGDIATPYYAELADELAKAAEERGYRLMTQPTRWNVDKEFEALEMLLTRAVDGILIYSTICETHRERIEKLSRSGQALVFLGSASGTFSSVLFDVRPGMLELFAYLGENGIRDIALMDDLRFPQKPQAYRFACGRYGITPRCYDFQYGDLASEEACIDRGGGGTPRAGHRRIGLCGRDDGQPSRTAGAPGAGGDIGGDDRRDPLGGVLQPAAHRDPAGRPPSGPGRH